MFETMKPPKGESKLMYSATGAKKSGVFLQKVLLKQKAPGSRNNQVTIHATEGGLLHAQQKK
jgi:hypothetical protein